MMSLPMTWRSAGQNFLLELLGQAAQGRDMHAVVRQFNVRQRGRRRVPKIQRIAHPGDQQPVRDGIEAFGTLWMPGSHLMFPEIRVREIPGLAHSNTPARRFLEDFSVMVMSCSIRKNSKRF